MLTLDVVGVNSPVKVSFGYLALLRPVAVSRLVPSIQTTCTVSNPETGDELGTGSSSCSPGDNFCRETGRKIALARALRWATKEQRRQIWAAYHTRRGRPERAR